MATKDIQEKLDKEQARLHALEEKHKEIEAKIKNCKANIAKLQMTMNTEQAGDIIAALHSKGLTVEEIIASLNSGDLLGLQEKMERAQTVE